MKITLICVGTRMPDWVEAGVAEYKKRLPRDFELIIAEIPLAQRSKNSPVDKAMLKEAQACMRVVASNDYLVALDVKGRSLSTEVMAQEISRVRDEGFNLALLVGGPDGLAPQCLKAAKAHWSLSALTFPHPIVRVILAEQLYRAWSLLAGHPYHRS